MAKKNFMHNSEGFTTREAFPETSAEIQIVKTDN